jgi:hypothetical protein
MTRLLLIFAAGLGAAPALAQPPAEGIEGRQPEIVVTGIRIRNSRDRLAACLARNCPVNEDVDATLALAEALFESGEAGDARNAIRKSLNRNRRHSRQYPEPVADLYRSVTRVNRHLGRDEEATRSAHSILRTLHEGIPVEDERHFIARLEIAEVLYNRADVGTGGLSTQNGNHNPAAYRLRQARQALMSLAQNAREAGREDLAVYAELRATWMEYLMASHGPAFRRLSDLAEDTRPQNLFLAVGAKILLARIHRDRGETGRSDVLIGEAARALAGRRNLIFSPPYELYAEGGNAQFEDQSVDVGYWIGTDGRVRDLEVMGFRGSADWAQPLLRSLRGRIYSTSADGMSTYRLERYTYTAGFGEAGQTTGTRMPVRTGHPRVEFYDLSGGEPGQSAPPSTRPPSNYGAVTAIP